MRDLIDANTVAALLGVKYNSVFSLERKGLLQRVADQDLPGVRFDRAEVLAYRTVQQTKKQELAARGGRRTNAEYLRLSRERKKARELTARGA